MIDLWEAQQQLKRPDTRSGKIRALQESAALFSFMQANEIKTMQQLHEKISDMNTRYYDLRREIVKAERRIAVLTERGEMWAQYNEYKAVHKQLARVKPEKRELFEQRHSRELILYDAAARYLKELKASGEELSPKEWWREIDLLTAQKQADSIDMKAMREELKAVERLRKAADPTGPDRNGTSPATGGRSGKGYGVLPTSLGASRFTTPFYTQKNRRTGFPIRRQTAYLPNKSLCDPVRASVSTSTSSSIR